MRSLGIFVNERLVWMEFSFISSKDNKLVKSVRKLITSTRERKQTGCFVLEGLRLCADAALNGYNIETLIISENFGFSDKTDVIIIL